MSNFTPFLIKYPFVNIKVNTLIKTKLSKEELLSDYRIACESRAASILGRQEVFMGKAKFGIFGDGKEIPQLAMAKVFKKGDFRSGYYRDQTFMMAIGELSIQQFFAQLYGHSNVNSEPASAGRMMNCHFGTRTLDNEGKWRNLSNIKNSASDISPNGSQMPRLLGLSYASKLYRENKGLQKFKNFSNKGNEIAFGTIGNASTSEGMFFETVNAAGVLQVPMLVSIWDDDYGISVPNEYHTTKASISKALAGFQRTKNEKGFEIYTVKGWDYQDLVNTYYQAEQLCRKEHVPIIIHVTELTQPQGHSTSGSHERYKSKERLKWEKENDCIKKFREWLIINKFGKETELVSIEKQAMAEAKKQKDLAWEAYIKEAKIDQDEYINILKKVSENSNEKQKIEELIHGINDHDLPTKSRIIKSASRALGILKNEYHLNNKPLVSWLNNKKIEYKGLFNSYTYSESSESALLIPKVSAEVNDSSKEVDGREVLRSCFDQILKRDERVFFIGEDVGKIGDVNQGLAGLQEEYGELRVTDTSIRECTILGQGIGAAMRGLRPIVEMQYLDYLLYALQIMSDDLSTLQYRTKGGQKAPVIIRTRGHRLEGIWHSGSYMSSIINLIRGIYVLVPRNMTQAAGFYNTMLKSDDSALIVERLNAYRIKEKIPENIDKFMVPIGVPEILRKGENISVVTYGAMCDIVLEAAEELSDFNISCEVIDVQTLLPFDINKLVLKSLKKTNRIVFIDEDVPGGATAYMMQKVIEEQGGFKYLDSPPATISSKEHRPAYGDDGDYFSKPNVEEIFEKIYDIMSESEPIKYTKPY